MSGNYDLVLGNTYYNSMPEYTNKANQIEFSQKFKGQQTMMSEPNTILFKYIFL